MNKLKDSESYRY